MPRQPRRTRHRHGSVLQPAMRILLVEGRLAEWQRGEVPHGFGSGVLDAFLLLGRVHDLAWAHVRPDVRRVLVELEALYHRHHAELDTAATAAGLQHPWVATVLETHADESLAATPEGETPWICSALAAEIEKRSENS